MELGRREYLTTLIIIISVWGFVDLAPISVALSAPLAAVIILPYFLKNKYSTVWVLIAFYTVSALLVVFGLTKFNFLPQLSGMTGDNPISLLISGNIWGPRFLIEYPSILLAKFPLVSIDQAFTAYSLILLMLITVCITSIGALFSNRNRLSRIAFGLLSASVLCGLSVVMNGRLVAAYLGLAIVLYVQVKALSTRTPLKHVDFMTMFIGFGLSTVSSGTMMVTFAQMVFVGPWVAKRVLTSVNLVLIWEGIILALSGRYLLKMMTKNLTFFGGGLGGFIHMMTHGLGRLFFLGPIKVALALVVLGLLVVLLLVLYVQTSRNEPALLPVLVSMMLALVCGIFGLSTATMFIVPALIYGAYVVTRTHWWTTTVERVTAKMSRV